ncbi:MAG: FtsQ-type POTRA domain-containing protein [Chlorobium sp.]|nr:FtsQ-type POTRA domain-containing protein [Chlorobium sp.]
MPAKSGSRATRLFIFLMVLAALIALASYASRWKKGVLVRGFVVDNISLISERDIVSRVSDFKGRNMEKLDTKELKKRISMIPYLRDAEISKELNGIVRVRVFEREPVAVTLIDGQMMVIDREGFLLLNKTESVTRQGSPLIKISGITRLQVAANGLPQLEKRDVDLIRQFLDALSKTDYASLLIGEFHLEGNNMAWCVTAQSPTRFIIGNDGNYKEKLKKFEIFWKKVVSKKGFDFYETVDLRFRDRIFTKDTLSPKVPQDVSL